jgi:tRNA threonylcarbamoyladenosine biosynthesis protein TsaE
MPATVPPESEPVEVPAGTEDATADLGRQLATVLEPGAVVALVGDLGAGKTRLVKAIAVGLGIPAESVNSPTFTLVQEYPGPVPLRHCDTYRLRDPGEFLDLGLDELLAPDGIALIEWADRVMHLLPRDLLRIEIRIVSPTAREFVITATGKSSRTMLAKLRAVIASTRH